MPPGRRDPSVRAAADVEGCLLRTEAVSKSFGGLRAVKDVTTSFEQGHVTGLIGPNGSGKSTLINLMSGLLAPTTGRVILDGAALPTSTHRVARVGVTRTFQSVRLFRNLTALENIQIPALANGMSTRDAVAGARRIAEALGIGHLADLKAGALAYGDQRRVEIARAVAGRPRLVLLDEPAAGMNEAESTALGHTIRRLPMEFQCGVVLVEHDIELVMTQCDRVHVLLEGTLIASGEPEAIRKDSKVIDAYIGQGDRK